MQALIPLCLLYGATNQTWLAWSCTLVAYEVSRICSCEDAKWFPQSFPLVACSRSRTSWRERKQQRQPWNRPEKKGWAGQATGCATRKRTIAPLLPPTKVPWSCCIGHPITLIILLAQCFICLSSSWLGCIKSWRPGEKGSNLSISPCIFMEIVLYCFALVGTTAWPYSIRRYFYLFN